jgi:hypothetical protein
MSTVELRQKAKKAIDKLSGDRLRAATSFLSFMETKKPRDATAELLSIPGFLASFGRGLKDVRAGKVKHWREVRRDV